MPCRGAAPDQPFGLLARTTATTWSGGDADVPAGRVAFFVMSLE